MLLLEQEIRAQRTEAAAASALVCGAVEIVVAVVVVADVVVVVGSAVLGAVVVVVVNLYWCLCLFPLFLWNYRWIRRNTLGGNVRKLRPPFPLPTQPPTFTFRGLNPSPQNTANN